MSLDPSRTAALEQGHRHMDGGPQGGLVGFGVDSAIEVTSSLAALWRLRWDADEVRREAAERRRTRS